MKRWLAHAVPVLLILGGLRPRIARADGAGGAPPAPAATPAAPAATQAAAAEPLPPGTYRNFPLSPAEAASVPSPDKDTFTLQAKFGGLFAQIQDAAAKSGASSFGDSARAANQGYDQAIFDQTRSAYALGWREFAHQVAPEGRRLYYWRVNGTKLDQVSVTFKSGSVRFQPTFEVSPGWGDSTYVFSSGPAPALGATDFPLCLKATGKPKHSGPIWSQACATEDPLHPQVQLARLYGWNVVKTDAKGNPRVFQKSDRFVKVTQGTNIEVTEVAGATRKSLLLQFPKLVDGARTHPISGTGLVIHGKYIPGPYRLELRDGHVTATAKAGSGVIWAPTVTQMPSEAVLDRMTTAGYWPTLRLVARDGRVSDIRTNDSLEKVIGQVGKIAADTKTDDGQRLTQLSRLPGGWSNVPPDMLSEVLRGWASLNQ